MTAAFTGHIPRPSHLLLHHKPLTVATTVAAVVLGLVAAIHPAWLLEVDRPISDAFRGDALEGFFRFWTKLGSQQDMIVGGLVLSVLLWPICRPFAVAAPRRSSSERSST